MLFEFLTVGLEQTDKDILTARLRTDVKFIDDNENEVSSVQIRSAFFDWKVWFFMFVNIGAITPVYSLGVFLPTIIKDMNYSNATAQLLTVPPYCASGLTTLISSWNAGRLGERSNHMMIFLLIGISGFLYLRLMKSYLYFGAILACIGVYSSNALVLSWVTNNIGGQTKRAVATAMVVAFGSIGGILSGQIYFQSDAPSYHMGHSIIIGIMSFTFVLVLILKSILKHENKRRRSLITSQFEEESIISERQFLLDKVNFKHKTSSFESPLIFS